MGLCRPHRFISIRPIGAKSTRFFSSCRSVERRASAIFYTAPVEAGDRSSTSKLVFHRYGQRIYLSKLLNVDRGYMSELPRPRAEKESREQSSADEGRVISPAPQPATEIVIVGGTQ